MKTPEEKILKEFDKEFVSKGIGLHPEREQWGAEPYRVKSFLRSALSNYRQSLLRSVEEKMDEMKMREFEGIKSPITAIVKLRNRLKVVLADLSAE